MTKQQLAKLKQYGFTDEQAEKFKNIEVKPTPAPQKQKSIGEMILEGCKVNYINDTDFKCVLVGKRILTNEEVNKYGRYLMHSLGFLKNPLTEDEVSNLLIDYYLESVKDI